MFSMVFYGAVFLDVKKDQCSRNRTSIEGSHKSKFARLSVSGDQEKVESLIQADVQIRWFSYVLL